MTSLLDAHSVGTQTPRHLAKPEYTSSSGRYATELAAEAGLFLDPWQQDMLEYSLGEREDGSWAANEIGLILPRQNGKNAVVEARELAGLFLLGEQLILHSAQLFPTAIEAFRRITNLIENTPALRSKVAKITHSHGAEGIELKTGARLRFVARSRSAIRGFSGDCLVMDEAYDLSEAAMEAMLPTLSARPNAQIWYTSSAPLPESDVLRRICLRGRGGESPRLMYAEWCADDDVDPSDRAAWAQANPGLGIRLSEEFTERELATLTTEGFLRERLGVWTVEEAATVIPLAQFNSLSVGVRPMNSPVFSVEVGLDRHAVIGGAWESRGRKHVEVIEDRPGTDWIVPRLAELTAKYSSPLTVVDGGTEAGSMALALEHAGVHTRKIDTAARVAACGALHEAVVNGSLSHSGDPALSAAVENARWKDAGDGARVFSRRRSAGSIGELYAVTLALYGLANATPVDFFLL